MTATYDSDNQVASFNGVNSSEDANGSLTSDPSNNGTYTWNERNQLASATVGGVTTTFQYDALGRRVQQIAGSTSDNYVYDGRNPVQIQSSMSGNIDILSGLWLDDWFTSTDSGGSVDLLRNALGSTIGLVNSAGNIATSYGYAPFGKTTQSGGSTTNPYAFAGRALDSSGLYFMRARYYNPVLSRFISQDPLGLGGGQPNFFSYTGNNPTNFVDPTGRGDGPSQPNGYGDTWTWSNQNQSWSVTGPGHGGGGQQGSGSGGSGGSGDDSATGGGSNYGYPGVAAYLAQGGLLNGPASEFGSAQPGSGPAIGAPGGNISPSSVQIASIGPVVKTLKARNEMQKAQQFFNKEIKKMREQATPTPTPGLPPPPPPLPSIPSSPVPMPTPVY